MVKKGYRLDRLDEGYQLYNPNAANLNRLEQKFRNGLNADTVVVFLDLASFSSHSRGWAASRIKDFLDSYYDIAIPEIDHHNGIVEKCIGDGIVANFGPPFFPDSLEEAVANAVLAMNKIFGEVLDQLNIHAKCSLCSGEAFFGYLGSGTFVEPTMVGELLTCLFRLDGHSRDSSINYLAETLEESVIREQFWHWKCLYPDSTEFLETREPVYMQGVGSRVVKYLKLR